MTTVSSAHFVQAAVEALRPAHTVLDIGPGIRPQTLVECRHHVCVEPFDQYVRIMLAENPGLVVLGCTWAEMLDLLPPASVDTVVLMDVIEHLPKDEGRALLSATVLAARSQVVVQTPLGFMAQGADESKDAWDLDGIDWQVHRSGWTPDDFPGWSIISCDEFHTTDAYGRALETPHGAFFAILDKGPGHEPGELVRLRRWRRTTKSRVGILAYRIGRKLGVLFVRFLAMVVDKQR